MSDVKIEVVNVVATCRLPFKVDLESLAAMLPGQVKLNSRYPRCRCAYVKVEGMRGVVAVFGSRAMIGVGSLKSPFFDEVVSLFLFVLTRFMYIVEVS